MNFGDSKVLLLLWALPICLFIVFVEIKKIRRRFAAFARLRIDDLLIGTWSYKRAYFKSFLLILSLISLVFALARPRWDFEWKEVRRSGTDIVVALDLSTSMLANDMSPSRIERAKREIIDLLKLLRGDRLGIVAFAGVAFMYTPLTLDYKLVGMFLQQMNLKMMPVQGTVIGEALNKSIEALEKNSDAESQAKAVVLITDGEDPDLDLSSVIKKAKDKSVKIYTVGIGSELGAPIPLPEGGFKKDRDGNIVVSKLGEESLKRLALETGGIYVRSSSGNLDLDIIYKSIKEGGDTVEGETSRQKIWHERFQIFLALALSLLVFEFFFQTSSRKKKRKDLEALALFFLCLSLSLFYSNNLKAGDARDGQKAFEKKDYGTASEKFLHAEINEPKKLEHAYNRGVSQYYNKDYKQAAEAFEKSAQSADKNLAGKSYFNLGNTKVAAGDLQAAVKAYEEALKIHPQDKDAQENLQWVKKKIEEEKNKKNSDQNKDENQDKKDKQEDQKNSEDKKDSKKEDQKNNEDKKQDPKNQENDKDQKNENKQEDQKSTQKKDDKEKEDASKESEKKEDEQKSNSNHSKSEEGQEKEGESKGLSKQEAEKLLRMMENQDQIYGMPPQYQQPSKNPERDW